MKGTSVDALMLTVVRVVTMLLGLACVKVVSVYFSLDEFGLYSQAMLIVSTVGSLIILGLSDGVNYFFNSEKSRTTDHSRAHYLSTIFMIETIIGLIAGALIIAASPLLTDYFANPAMNSTYVWIALQPLMQSYMAMFSVLYISLGKTKLIVLFNLLFSIFRLCIFLIGALYTKNIITLIELTLILDVAQVLAFIILLKGAKLGLTPQKFVPALCKPILKYSVPIAMFVLINSLLRDCDKWVIGRLGNTDELALYTNASRILPFDMMMGAFATVLVPIITRYASTAKDKAAEVLGQYLNLGLFTTTILVGTALCFSKDLMLTLYDAKYLPGLGVFVTFLFVDFVRFANVSLIFNATGHTRELLKVILITLIINVISAIILYKSIGITGPAIGTLISMVLCNFLYLHRGREILERSLLGLLNWKRFILIATEIAIAGGVLSIVGDKALGDINTIVRFVVLYSMTAAAVGLLNYKPIIACLRALNAEK